MFQNKISKGFTLIEILLVVAAIAILASIVIIAINPTKQLGDTRNAARRVDVTTILNAVYQYSIDNNGTLPSIVSQLNPGSTFQICRVGVQNCQGLNMVDLSVLTNNEKYLTTLPVDPSGGTQNGIGYFVARSANNRVTISAPSAEQGAIITVTR